MLLLLIFDCLFLTAYFLLSIYILISVYVLLQNLVRSYLFLLFLLFLLTSSYLLLSLLQFRAGIYPLLALRAAILSICADSCV